ncbi:MAG TPA: UdgX family uracil-DNA binding protein [Casimicrobiaceae bacterium]|nr:UdgX family uracil-DNA binding protein [Casimicrobiaceae bacterium]
MPSIPPSKTDVDACRRCELWKRATQGVPGEGARRARLLLVGEQPGDEEDRQGKPFVGPAGRVLRGALAEAGIPGEDVFVTNAVKHFSWEPRGKRRIHKTPTQQQIAACIDWLDAEIAAIRPRVIVTLGATALRAILAKKVAVGAARGEPLTHASGTHVVATWHPSAILRAPDDAGRPRLHADLVADLKRSRELAQQS